jgi:hypothetical protein
MGLRPFLRLGVGIVLIYGLGRDPREGRERPQLGGPPLGDALLQRRGMLQPGGEGLVPRTHGDVEELEERAFAEEARSRA